MPNEALDRMTRSAASRVFQCDSPWRVPRHRSAFGGIEQRGHFEQEATGTEMESVLCFLRYLLLNSEAAAFRPDDGRGFLFVCFASVAVTFPPQWQGRPSPRIRRGRPEIFKIM